MRADDENGMDEIVKNIIAKKLPLPKEQWQKARAFCDQKMLTGELTVLGKLPEVLYRDWVDESLPIEVRAHKHVNVTPEEWRAAMEDCCRLTIEAFANNGNGGRRNYDVAALLVWRSALAYLPAVVSQNTRVFHIQLKRTPDLKIETPMPLSSFDAKSLVQYSKILVPDPMVAAGTTGADAIDFFKTVGVENERITVLCTCTVPEGVYRLLNCYPGIKIITLSLDHGLNANAYIEKTGLGDGGEKYFYGNCPANFLKYRGFFDNAQWGQLVSLLDEVNNGHSGH